MRPALLAAALALATPASADAPPARAPGAIVLVIDRSLTSHGPGLDAMKAAALASIAALSPGDQVAVVAFDRDAEIVAPLQRPANRARLARAISKLRAEGGTDVYAGLKAAHEILKPSTLTTKHVVLLSDGDAPDDGLGELVADMRAHGQTLSIVGIPAAPPRTATCCRAGDRAHRTLMTLLAKGSGRLYFVDDPASLPKTVAADVEIALK
jgi:Ca-activated chloride channel family protein